MDIPSIIYPYLYLDSIAIYISLTLYLSISLPLYLYISNSISLYLSTSLPLYLYISLSLYPSISLSLYLYISISLYLYIYMALCSLAIWISAYMTLRLYDSIAHSYLSLLFSKSQLLYMSLHHCISIYL